MSTDHVAVTAVNAYLGDNTNPPTLIVALRVSDEWQNFRLPMDVAVLLADMLELITKREGTT